MVSKKILKQRKKWQKTAVTLISVLLLAVFTALLVAFPDFYGGLLRALGVTQAQQVPATGLSSPVSVHIINVGQGDAALLEAHGEFALIDAGPPEAADVLVAYLRGAGVARLRYLFMTHPHADHIGGMRAVVEAFGIDRAVFPNFELAPLPTTSTFENLLEALTDRAVPVETARQGVVYALGGGSVRVVHAGLATPDNYNLLSLGLLFEAEGLRFLDTGDGEKANERAMLESGQPLDAQVFMAAHHGSSATSNTRAFLEAVRPGVVVVSCGAQNSYGHPHSEALAVYAGVGAAVLRTDEDGHVVVQPNGRGGVVYATAAMREAAA
jgi:beta-lactamase superfamily II metal-dependent hydrolase